MKNKLSTTYFILITAPLFFGCGGSVKKEDKNNASASSISLHAGNEKYFIIDMKESVVAWKGSSVGGAHEGYVSRLGPCVRAAYRPRLHGYKRKDQPV